MLPWLVRRLVGGVGTVLAVVSLCFVILHALPGDPVDGILGDSATPADRARLRSALHLDLPLPSQYVAYLADLALPSNGMGRSFRPPHPTAFARIREVWPSTLLLALAAAAFAWIIAIPLALLSALRPASRTDGLVGVISLLGVAIPSLWLGPALILLFCVAVPVLPFPGPDTAPLAGVVLPALTLGTGMAGMLTRMGRGSLRDVLREPYITAARARGLSETTVMLRHALRSALVPLLTTGGAQLAGLLGGAILTERIFDRPGLGTLLLESLGARDIPVVLACVAVMAVTAVAVQVVVDVGYALVDPRIRVA